MTMYRHTTMSGPKFLRWGWHREMLGWVIADIGAFLERGDLDTRGSTGPEEARHNNLSSVVSVGFPRKLGSSQKYVGSMT